MTIRPATATESASPHHSTSPVLQVAVIINAHAGGGHADELAQRVADGFRRHQVDAHVTLAADGTALIDAARAALEDGAGIIVAGGGDGSVNAVASVVSGSQAAFGVLPLGTLNHFVKDLNIPLALDDAIRNIVEGRRLAIDTGEVNGVLFINNSSLGLYPDIVRDREKQQSRLGRGKWLAFCWAAMGALRRYPFLDVRMDIRDDGDNAESHRRRTPFVFIGNNEYLMDGFNIGKRNSLSEGKLSLYVCHRTGRLGLVRLALHALFGRLEQARDFDILSAAEIEIDTRHGHGRHRVKRVRVATDGEVTIMQTPLVYRIRPASLTVIVPAIEDADSGAARASSTSSIPRTPTEQEA
ncbi:sphingosine kinase [Herbaspirillum hiltneri N3]|uniref:Sphingosine kinase n=1 Tax=Herbaspirillum hiltneri N3 TaxID=1262470 RepID=A0ABN4HZG4_9BURK|nr:diacylglycerol kinase family protein [Herbaspirillum hiltneri]AKZ63587.1 sphingosine kinase [Herbaspirillum hiltneri N3]